MRIGGRALSFVAAVVLTRSLGISGFGVYSYAIAWTTLLTLTSTLGVDRLLVRFIATYAARSESDLLAGIVRRADQVMLVASLVVMAVFALITLLVVGKTYAAAMLVALPLIPLQGLIQVDQATLQGLHKPELSLVPLFILAPGLLIIGMLGANLLLDDIKPTLAVGIAGGGTAIALICARILRHESLRKAVTGALPAFDRGLWLRSLTPLAMVALITNGSAQIDAIMLGLLGDAGDVGRFQVALRVAQVVSLILAGINTALAPRIARFHALGDEEGLREAAVSASRFTLLYSVPVAALVVIFNQPLFSIFGTGGADLRTVVCILIAAELINAALGSVGIVLTMTGRGGVAARAMFVGLALDAVLCVLLIPPLGAVGAAIASGADLVLWNIVLWLVVRRSMRFDPSAFGGRSVSELK